MKTVVITESTRGLGFEMAKRFRISDWNLVINGVDKLRLEQAIQKLQEMPGSGAVEGYPANVSDADELQRLADFAFGRFDSVDIWINNAGVNQPMKPIWELNEEEIDTILNIDLRGAVLGSRLAVHHMESQPDGGYIYNVEGHGSNDAIISGLSMYGTSKRAVTYFTQALAKELEERGSRVKAGRLSPGIMITDFICKALGGKESIALQEKSKKIYNILGDYPDVVATYLVQEILENTKNNAHIEWLTKGKAARRFLTASFNKRDFFGN